MSSLYALSQGRPSSALVVLGSGSGSGAERMLEMSEVGFVVSRVRSLQGADPDCGGCEDSEDDGLGSVGGWPFSCLVVSWLLSVLEVFSPDGGDLLGTGFCSIVDDVWSTDSESGIEPLNGELRV